MKTGITYVDRSKFEALLVKHGFGVMIQSGFLRVDGPRGNRIYVAATKRVGRVDISGFEVGPTVGKTPHMGVSGNVKQQLRMDGTEDEVLERFEKLLEELKTQTAKEPKPKAAAKPKAAPKTDGDATGEVEAAPAETVSPVDEASAARRARLASIAKVKELAAKMNQTVSKKILAEEAELLALETAPATIEAPAETPAEA